MKEVTFGQYYPTVSFVHKMDARIKILLSIAFIVAVFLVQEFRFYGFLACFVFVVATTLFAKISELVDTNITVEFLLSNAELIFSYSSYNCYEMTYPGKYSKDDNGDWIFTPEVKNAVDMFYSHRLPYDITE